MTTTSEKPLCLIPARGGSRRLPRKNIALLGGKPLLAWTIDAARESGVFETIYVTSEDPEILATAQKRGATPLPRPVELAGDRVTLVQLCRKVVQHLAAQGQEFSALYLLLPTSPFRTSDTIRQAWERFQESETDALMSVVMLEHPPQWAMVESEGFLQPYCPDEYELPRQDLQPVYQNDGGHVIVRMNRFLELGVFLCPRTVAFPVPREEAVDINEALDMRWAEFLLGTQNGE